MKTHKARSGSDSHKSGSGRHVDQFGKTGFSGTSERISRVSARSVDGSIGSKQSMEQAFPGKTFKGGKSGPKVFKV